MIGRPIQGDEATGGLPENLRKETGAPAYFGGSYLIELVSTFQKCAAGRKSYSSRHAPQRVGSVPPRGEHPIKKKKKKKKKKLPGRGLFRRRIGGITREEYGMNQAGKGS